MADAGQNIRKLFKDGFVIRKPVVIHSRSRARAAAEAKAKGRHSGYGTTFAYVFGKCKLAFTLVNDLASHLSLAWK